jgi:hypothetical protein
MMDRLAELISKLKEQFEQNADRRQLMVITQMIQEELLRTAPVEKPANITSKVAVVMPSSSRPVVPPVPDPVPEPVAHPVKQPVQDPGHKAYIPKEEPVKVLKEEVQDTVGLNYDPLQEVPTLAQQTAAREINEVMRTQPNSLNDQLKTKVVEVGHKLTDSPIRDLKKAIGINDRYVFINELFRGDEVMYERSIKTINNFKILPEAEYWIQRELKVKLGWDEGSGTVKHFDQLVKRRFL